MHAVVTAYGEGPHGQTCARRVEDKLGQDVSGDTRPNRLPAGQRDRDFVHLAIARRRLAEVGGDGGPEIQTRKQLPCA